MAAWTADAAKEVELFILRTHLQPGARVLDLGCGAGRHAIEFARRGYAVTGVDASDVLLAEARKRASEAGVVADFIQADMFSWVKGHSLQYEMVTSLHEAGFGELGGDESDQAFLHEANRRLVSGGWFVLITFNGLRRYRNPGPAFDHIRGIVHWSHTLADGSVARSDIRVYTPSELGTMLRRAGFVDATFCACGTETLGDESGLDDIEVMVIASKQTS